MKKSVLFTTSLCTLLCGAFCFQSAAAFAEGSSSYDSYPENFKKTVQFENLKDYAIGSGKYYFLENNVVSVYSNDSYSTLAVKEKAIDSLHYDNGFYYGAEGKVFDFNDVEAENFTAEESGEFYVKGYLYSCGDDELIVYNTTTGEQKLSGFTNLKKFDDTAYAVKDNVLYRFDGASYAECVLEYSDYSPVESIAVGDTAEKLRNAQGKEPAFVRLNQDAFITKITDLNNLSGEFFSVGETIKTDAKNALLLCTTGADNGIAVIALNDSGSATASCYMTRRDNLREISRNSIERVENTTFATVTIAEGFIYSSPYVSAATQAAKIISGDKVEILGNVKKETNPEILRDFYIVRLNDEVSGYVPHEYVSMFTYIEKEPEKTVDPDYSEEDMIRPVVLIIIVIALVLIAVSYLVYVGTSDKRRKQNKNTENK